MSVHGRLYCSNLPKHSTEQSVKEWVEPESVKVFEGGMDLTSCLLHYKATQGQLSTFAEQLTGHWLTHKATKCEVSNDTFKGRGKGTGIPNRKLPQPLPKPASSTGAKRSPEATWPKEDVSACG